MWLGQRSRSQWAIKVCAFKNLCPTHIFIIHGGIYKLFGRNDHLDKTICCVPEYVAWSKVKVTVGTESLCIPDSCPTHNFIMHSGI